LLQGIISHGGGEGWGLDERDVYRTARSCGRSAELEDFHYEIRLEMQKWGNTNIRVATGDNGTLSFLSFSLKETQE